LRKVRIYQLARELKLSGDTLLGLLQEIDASIQSQMAAVDAEVVERLKERLAGDRGAAKREGPRHGEAVEGAPAPARRRPAMPAPAEPAVAAAPTLPPLPKAPDLSALLLHDAPPISAAVPPPARPLGPVSPPRVGRGLSHPPELRLPATGAPGRTY
jgi:hypothetical protein